MSIEVKTNQVILCPDCGHAMNFSKYDKVDNPGTGTSDAYTLFVCPNCEAEVATIECIDCNGERIAIEEGGHSFERI